MNIRYQDIIDILNEVIHIIQSTETDVTWSGYHSVEAALSDLNDHINRLAQNDLSRKTDLVGLFLPTGPLQDISIDSSWSDQFLGLAERFDHSMEAAWDDTTNS